MKFTDLGLCPELLAAINKLGFETPTPVQQKVIPFLLENDQDLVALAQTGTGKTAAFGLPILEMIEDGHRAPQALILCPTRELCMQIARDLQSFASCMSDVKVLAVYGGADIKPQLAALERGVQIVVATPGRMLDILRRKRADFSFVERVVLDEADEMLNMGFEEELEGVLSSVPDIAQTLLFSATMPKEVAKISQKYMDEPEEITVGSRNAGSDSVTHEYIVVHAKDRYRALRRMVDFYPRMYGIVFCRTRQETQQVADHLSRDGYNAEPLHGDLSQAQRDRVMKRFREHHVQILVATDVAARGLDVNDLTHVINYQLPDELAAYTHRSGRTGRAGKEGVSIAIVHMREHHKIKRLEKAFGKKFEKRLAPTGEEIARVRLLNLAEHVLEHNPGTGLIDANLKEMVEVLQDVSKEEIIRRFASLDLRKLLLYYRDAPDLNETSVPSKDPNSQSDMKRATREKENREPRQMTPGMVELVMNVGSINGLSPKRLMSIINVADREKSIEIGRINIVDKQAYFEVPEADAQDVIDSFEKNHVDCQGRRVSAAMAGSVKKNTGAPKRKGPPKRNKSGGGKPFEKFEKSRKGGRGQGGRKKRR